MEDFSRYVQQFEEAEAATVTGRAESEKARDYFDGRQFTSDEQATLKKRGQPITPENLIRPKIESLCGIERQGRVDPKAYPRVPSKESDADAVTDALRYVEQDQDFDLKKSGVFGNMLVEGEGAVEVTVRQGRGGVVDPYIVRIAWNRIYGDPHSSELDRSDAAYVGYITWMDADKARKKWPDAASVIDATMQKGTSARFDTYEDKPRWSYWSDSKRNRIRVNTHYHQIDGVWHRCVFTLGGELEPSAPSVFLDDEGNPENPLILQAAYVDRDNDRYGVVRDMIPLQDEVNKRRSKFLHLVSSNRWRVSPRFQEDKRTLKKELAAPDGIVVGEVGDVESLDTLGKDQGQFQLLMDTRQTLKGNIGPNAYLQGKAGESQSGRAVLAQQQAGMVEITPLLDGLRHFTIRVYRQIWNRIRQYWTAERWIRVTDDENNVRFVGLNRPPEVSPEQGMAAMQMIQMHVQAGQLDPQTAQQYAQQIQQKMQVQNHLAELDVDIDIEEVNETPSLQAEEFQQIGQALSSGVFGRPPDPRIAAMWIKASSIREKQDMIDILKDMQQQAGQNPMQQLQVAGAQAQIEETKSKAALNIAKANSEHAGSVVNAFQAEVAAQQPQIPPQF